jgi:ubiquinone/menaquinone biosynthesis C-methylase UbiE
MPFCYFHCSVVIFAKVNWPEMTNSVKDIFSSHADLYAKYRPLYPRELYEFVLGHVPGKAAALDCGTGNGQAAGVLAEHFTEVHATDISEKQIQKAIHKDNLFYHVCKAENLPLADNYFDLITSATAVHWFQFDQFFAEIKRVGKNNSVFACWAYKVVRTNHENINNLIDRFYGETIHSYWDAERRHVDEEYKDIPMPFREVKTPSFATQLSWDLQTLEGYLNTWSAVQHYIRKNQANPVKQLMEELNREVGAHDKILMTFPIFMRMGIISK